MALIEMAVTSFRQISSRADVRELYRSGAAYHEVPFTMQVDGRIVRGTIDCLIASSDRVTVLEFKTGRPRNEHRAKPRSTASPRKHFFLAFRSKVGSCIRPIQASREAPARFCTGNVAVSW